MTRIEKFYYILCGIFTAQFCLMPLVFQLYARYTRVDMDWGHIYSLNMPFDQTQPVVYEMIYIAEFWITIYSVSFAICTDLLFACLMQILVMEFKILGQIMSEIDEAVAEKEEEAMKELKKLIGIHQQLIEVSEKLEKTFSPLLLINAFGSIVSLCTACFLSVSGIGNYFIAKYFIFPFAISVQIFTQCYFSQELIDSSASISTSAYSTEWYLHNMKFKQLVLQVIARAQKAQTVTAYKFFDMSLETFNWLSMNQQSSHCILFRDFLRCETTSKLIGFSFFTKHDIWSNKWKKLNWFMYPIVLIVLLILEVISFIISVKNNLMVQMIDNIFCIGLLFIILFKIYFLFYRNRANIFEVIEELDKHFPHSGVDQLTFKAQKYFMDLKIVETVYYVTFTIITIQFCSMPFLHQIYARIQSIDIEWELILPVYLPFDELQPIVYYIILIIDIWLIISSLVWIACTDLLFASLMQVLIMEFDILGQLISDIDMTYEIDAIKELKKIVDIHQELIIISEKLEEIFAPLEFINAFGSITALCTAAFLAASKISGYFVVKYWTFPLGVPMQIFNQCYFTQLLIDSSKSISESVYGIDWSSKSVHLQRFLIQIMIRSQKHQTITACMFFEMSLENFALSLNIMIENIMFGGLFVLSLVQMYVVFYRNQFKIIEIVEKLEKHFPNSGFDQLTFDVQKYLKTTKWHEKGYYFITTLVILHFTMMPFIHQIYGIVTSTSVELELILSLYLPFDYLQPLLYGFIYFIQLWIIVFVTFYYICTDMIFANLTQILCLELDILGQNMDEIDPADDEEVAMKELKKLVYIHQQLIEASENLNEVFSPLQLINAFGSIAALCTAIFLVMSGISNYFIAKYFLLPIVISVQILTQCYFSQRLIDSSTSISASAYNIKWYSGSIKFQRLVLQIMIVNTSYSYFSVLQGTYGS
ncbi:unnamed protein product [Chironomus riparius]|uniref:Odorant receptor n=1 Tax=Chironomus riparius TaxID=315576 RepID=A0A9N9RS47_9DIPT|nr:unnamed protein product [Chironomus riparius]